MKAKRESIQVACVPTSSDGLDGGPAQSIQDPLHQWADIVEQDSQAETFEYLGESVAKHSGE